MIFDYGQEGIHEGKAYFQMNSLLNIAPNNREFPTINGYSYESYPIIDIIKELDRVSGNRERFPESYTIDPNQSANFMNFLTECIGQNPDLFIKVIISAMEKCPELRKEIEWRDW